MTSTQDSPPTSALAYVTQLTSLDDMPADIPHISLVLHNCVDKASIMSCLASAWDFPEHFGHNWDALYDCLLDFFEQPDSPERTGLLLTPAEQVDEQAISTLTALLEDVGEVCSARRKVHFYVLMF